MTTLPPGYLLAEDAGTASRHAGPCGICRFGILSGQRHARLRSGKLAHLVCIGRATWRLRIAKGARP